MIGCKPREVRKEAAVAADSCESAWLLGATSFSFSLPCLRMSYLALARKWRPDTFEALAGHASIVQVLSASLEQNHTHHAYLFTGPRGVGKTTLARLLAKCVSCEKHVSAHPCGVCHACQGIKAGTFLDLIEIDAASRTKVEDTRELLDTVQIAPVQGRYKIYLIDEVHMLSNHSFNALLKTLEEPPAHVKFLLATTDPQKLPATVLSRCLRFHLNNIPQDEIIQQLANVLDKEKVPYERPALGAIAQAAKGSMRDALNLLEQAISCSQGSVLELDMIQNLLGTADITMLYALLAAISQHDAPKLLKHIPLLESKGYDLEQALDTLLSLLHHIALLQIAPETSLDNSPYHLPTLQKLQQSMSPEAVQLYYQIALMGRKDLPFAPTPRIGFEMTVLRMLTFRPESISINAFLTPKVGVESVEAGKKEHAVAQVPQISKEPTTQKTAAYTIHESRGTRATKLRVQRRVAYLDADHWAAHLAGLTLSWPTRELASHCTLLAHTDEHIHLCLDLHYKHLHNPTTEQELAAKLQESLKTTAKLVITQQANNLTNTPAQLAAKAHEKAQSAAKQVLLKDEDFNQLMEKFDAKLLHYAAREQKDSKKK